MALAEAILVCLTDRPMSGYDLAKNFDASIGFFWRASHQQIYRELGKLREKGYVASQELAQNGKPNRIVHTITDAGQDALRAWSTKPCRMPSVKDDLLVKFYALEKVDLNALKDQLTIRIEQHQSKLTQFHRIKKRHYLNKDLSVNQQGKLIALDMGIENEARHIAQLQAAMVKISEI